MNTKPNIFRDSDQDISKWSKNTLVKCPSCSGRAELRNDISVFQTYWNERAEINCSNCGYVLKTADLMHYRMELKRNCSNCGETIEKVVPNLKEPKVRIKVTCDQCGDNQSYEPRNIPIELKLENQSGIKDNTFGASLWLQEAFKNDVLWAYNYDHLNYLKDYVSAEIREREGMSTSAKLPQFIKDKGSRKGLLKIIEKMWRKKTDNNRS